MKECCSAATRRGAPKRAAPIHKSKSHNPCAELLARIALERTCSWLYLRDEQARQRPERQMCRPQHLLCSLPVVECSAVLTVGTLAAADAECDMVACADKKSPDAMATCTRLIEAGQLPLDTLVKMVLLTGPLKLDDFRDLVLAAWAFVCVLIVTWSLRKDADEYHTGAAFRARRTSNDRWQKSTTFSHSFLHAKIWLSAKTDADFSAGLLIQILPNHC